jgi:hypothetical protein
VPPLVDVEAFLANEPIKVSPMNVAELALEEPLQMIGGPIPTASVLGQPLGSNIKHILEDIKFNLEDSVGMQGDNMEPNTAEKGGAKAQPKPLSLILETGTASRALTPKRLRILTPARVD